MQTTFVRVEKLHSVAKMWPVAYLFACMIISCARSASIGDRQDFTKDRPILTNESDTTIRKLLKFDNDLNSMNHLMQQPLKPEGDNAVHFSLGLSLRYNKMCSKSKRMIFRQSLVLKLACLSLKCKI